MTNLRNASILLVLVLTALLPAQERRRINHRVDAGRAIRLDHSTHPLIRTGRAAGHAAADLPLERIQLQLSSSPEQLAALEQLLSDQHDPASPRFQQWLTPEEFGERFGPDPQDIEAVTAWLQENGLRVDGIGRGRRTLEFSGTVGQVEGAFQTRMYHYEVNGERHLANSTDLAIPEALAPVVAGVAGLHDFRHKAMHRVEGGMPAPLTNLAGGVHGLNPYDFAAIYNVIPLWNSHFDGAGQTIAIAGRSNIRLTDVAAFRTNSGLSGNNTQVILNGRDPGIVSAGEEMEVDLDVQWAGGVARSAAIKFVVSASTGASDGIDLSTQYIVNNNLAGVMSVSFGACEAGMGTGNQFYNALWQQAAAQGISVFVSSGDSGSAGCDAAGSVSPANQGLGVNGIASTPYNVAVGGTQFADTASPAAWWNASNNSTGASVKGYIPEIAWNESAYTKAGASGNSLYSGGGGVSKLYAAPAWQSGTGVPAGDPGAASQHHRYLPDVSLAAAGHDGYLVYRSGSLYRVGGTSAASPALAGLMAIINQYTGGRNGNPNTRFYSLAAQSAAAYHDVTSGTIAVPCQGGTAGCTTSAPAANVGLMTGYAAGKGYDLATGLGSVDAYAMAFNWGARPASGPSVVSLSPNPMTVSTADQTLTITGSGFLAGAKVTASYTGFTTTLPVSSLSATRIQAVLNPGMTARLWSITVTNPTGPVSNSLSLSVAAPTGAPVVTGVSPNPLNAGNANQVITISGMGFESGTGLKVVAGYAGYSLNLSGAQIAFVSSTQIRALLNPGATVRSWTIQVINPGGMASNTAVLAMAAPPALPSISSLTPNPMTHSASPQTLTINGSGFQPGALLRIAMVSNSGVSVVLQGSAIKSVSATRLEVTVPVGNRAGSWYVQVVNPNGALSKSATLTVK